MAEDYTQLLVLSLPLIQSGYRAGDMDVRNKQFGQFKQERNSSKILY